MPRLVKAVPHQAMPLAGGHRTLLLLEAVFSAGAAVWWMYLCLAYPEQVYPLVLWGIGGVLGSIPLTFWMVTRRQAVWRGTGWTLVALRYLTAFMVSLPNAWLLYTE
ncbi:hypothetical protein ACGF3G_24760 [Streptomyces sp. NPDC048179]|uniref:hypothetical protein n=1 Tax=Streptomyces sp. NPDC048179 TaxID=3365506 RepID=UPI00371F63A7